MRRRDFLILGASLAGTIAARPSFPQQTLVRAAVVIGVDKAGNLPALSAAASGARAMADWLASEGFEVKRFTDDAGEVRVTQIVDVVQELVERGTLDQLVIYFAGHGFLHSYSEHWMLSRAPDNSNEAISLLESWYQAKQSGIPNVVLISDACRSTPDSLNIGQVRGSVIFPNPRQPPDSVVKVDRFLAALPGSPALEVPIGNNVRQFEGIYTSTFLDAFKKPDADMITALPSGERVVPNRQLEAYLLREVPRRAQARNITLNQVPDSEVVSDPMTYIGRVVSQPQISSPQRDSQASIFDVLKSELRQVYPFSSLPPGPTASFPAQVEEVAEVSGYRAAQTSIFEAARAVDAGIGTGFSISGGELVQAVAGPDVQLEIVSSNVISVNLGAAPAASVALQFADGSGAVVAVLRDFVGRVVVGERGVSNVSYDLGGYVEDDIVRLRSIVAASAQFGVFKIAGEGETQDRNAQALADAVRMGKGADPTLGLYAAYAYHDADLIGQLRSVDEIMQGNLGGVRLFDVAMLAQGFPASDRNGGTPFQEAFNRGDLVPFCPMLSQGWAFLRVKSVALPPNVDAARDHLLPSLWTTFDAGGIELIISALHEGGLR
ncbi:caspase family protein [Mesorhizobium sp. WSM2239]|uniref:Caspase family protein n=2 Tax=unclassified Mesorhizobium TaxID=325217 RepID=A0AAU8DHU7_9HYPH